MFNNDVVLVALLLTLNIFHSFFSVSILNFENVNAGIFPPDLKHIDIQCITNSYNKVTFFFAKHKR